MSNHFKSFVKKELTRLMWQRQFICIGKKILSFAYLFDGLLIKKNQCKSPYALENFVSFICLIALLLKNSG